MRPFKIAGWLTLILIAAGHTLVAQTASFPLQRGELVATCFSGVTEPNNPATRGLEVDGFVVAVVDVRNPGATGGSIGNNWMAPMFHNETGTASQKWTARNLGQVFGLALDDANPPNIYVTATTSYGLFRQAPGVFKAGMFGPSGTGGEVYRLRGSDGNVELFSRLPNTGQGLGNIAFDPAHRQFFVSNFEDGLIYRIAAAGSNAGQILGTFDHGVSGRPVAGLAPIPDPKAPDGSSLPMDPSYDSDHLNFQSGFTTRGRRPWAVRVFGGRLYYSIWGKDQGHSSLPTPNEIWSIQLDAGGNFVASSVVREIDNIPPVGGSGTSTYTNPVSDIAFSQSGKMLIAERTINDDVGPSYIVDSGDGHHSRVFEYSGSTPHHWGIPKLFHIGRVATSTPSGTINANSEGGVTYGIDLFSNTDDPACDGTVWATGEQILQAPYVYGLQGTPASGNTFGSAGIQTYNIDLNRVFTPQDKSRIGDVEAVAPCEGPCLEILIDQILCPVENGDFVVRFRVRNRSTVPALHLFLLDLPAGVVAIPNYLSFSGEPGGSLAPGQTSGVQEVRLWGVRPGTSVALRLSLQDARSVECCAIEHSIEIPTCDCAQILRESVGVSPVGPVTEATYQFSLQNLTTDLVEYVLLTPTSPNLSILQSGSRIPPVGHGGTATQSVTLSGIQSGSPACFQISIHDGSLNQCCSIDRCVVVPAFVPDTPADLNLTLNTGFDQATGTALPLGTLPAGTDDADWQVVDGTAKKPAKVVINPRPAWPAALADSQWISANPNQGRSSATRTIQFENCFCLGAGATTAELSLRLRADDEAAVFLNGTRIGGPGGGFRGAPLAVALTGPVGVGGPFVAGQNCLRIEVDDRGGIVTGLDLTGTVKAAGGACGSSGN